MDRFLLPDHTDCIIDLTDCINASILDMTRHKSTVPFFSQFFKYLPQCRWPVVDIYLAALRLGKYLPLATSTSVNSC